MAKTKAEEVRELIGVEPFADNYMGMLAKAISLQQDQLDELRTIYIDPRPKEVSMRPGEVLWLMTPWGPVEASVSTQAVFTVCGLDFQITEGKR